MNFKEENIEAILEGMRGVTSESGGTAYSTFRNFNIEVGGKTGSAQTGVQGKTNAWFVGFAPFDDPAILWNEHKSSYRKHNSNTNSPNNKLKMNI